MTQYNATAQKILDAAERFTQTRGFNAFSYKDLQSQVGVKTSTIHYYFATKQALAAAMAERYVDRFTEALQKINRTAPQAPDALNAFTELFNGVAKSEKLCLCGMLTADALSLDEEALQMLSTFFESTETWLAQWIQVGVQDGSLRSDIDATMAASHLLATLEGALLIARTRDANRYMASVSAQALSVLVAPSRHSKTVA